MTEYQPVERPTRSPDKRRNSFGVRGVVVSDGNNEGRGRGLDTQERMLIEQRVANDSKSTSTAYLLWLFLGGLGAHRFYLGRIGTGSIMLGLWLIGIFTVFIGIGIVPLGILGIWVLIDAFRIPSMVRSDKETIRSKLSSEAMTLR